MSVAGTGAAVLDRMLITLWTRSMVASLARSSLSPKMPLMLGRMREKLSASTRTLASDLPHNGAV